MHHGSRGISGWLWQISQRNQLSPPKFYSSNHSKYDTRTEARDREREREESRPRMESKQYSNLTAAQSSRPGRGCIYILFELAAVASRCRNIYETATARPHTLSKLKLWKRVCSQLCGPDRLVIGCFVLPAVNGETRKRWRKETCYNRPIKWRVPPDLK